jgi:hypothetical protein
MSPNINGSFRLVSREDISLSFEPLLLQTTLLGSSTWITNAVLLITGRKPDSGGGGGAGEGADGRQYKAGWAAVGGLSHVVSQLREMVLLPLVYPEMFQAMGVQPPRWTLLSLRTPLHYGPMPLRACHPIKWEEESVEVEGTSR